LSFSSYQHGRLDPAINGCIAYLLVAQAKHIVITYQDAAGCSPLASGSPRHGALQHRLLHAQLPPKRLLPQGDFAFAKCTIRICRVSQIFGSIKAQVQRDFAEALLQLAVYPPGKTALLADPSVAPVSGCAVCRRRRRRKASSCCCCHLDGFCSYPQATHWPCLALEPRQ
jgi:hypothetical protein